MKIKGILILLLACLLVACDSQKEVDEKVIKYLSETHGLDGEIVYRESLNEGNMGDRVYVAETKGNPKIKFTIYLSGIFSTEIVGDDYKRQERVYYVGKEFNKKYEAELSQLNVLNVAFTYGKGIEVVLSYSEKVSVFHQETMKPIMEVINLLNSYKKEENFKGIYDSLTIHLPKQDRLFLEKIKEIQTFDQLKLILFQNVPLVNESLLMRDKELFVKLEKELKEIGFEYQFGIEDEGVNNSFVCYQDELVAGECTGGYELHLKGASMEKEDLFSLVSLLNHHPSLVFKEIFVMNEDGSVYIPDVKIIESLAQIETLLAGKVK